MALNLDPVIVNTELAQEYLKKHNTALVELLPDGELEIPTSKNDKQIGTYVARKLVEEIKKHESTFYQLEYQLRKTDKGDFQNYFQLMCQHLQCNSDSWDNPDVNTPVDILICDETPLYALGCVAFGKLSKNIPRIITTHKVAPICCLFSEICTKIGWPISFFCIENCHQITNECGIYNLNEAFYFRCIGVVTESADIDSALDHFINSSEKAPWKLQRIFVQESVYGEVKEALAGRCSREPIPSCSDAFAARGKLFVCDSMGAKCVDRMTVEVEAYRTARELCGLLQRAKASCAPPALSLWAADSQLAHEIALAAPAHLVWINEYATFHGPPESSFPLYEQFYKNRSYGDYGFSEADLRDLKQRWGDWNKLTKSKRIDSIVNALQSLESIQLENYGSVDFLNDILKIRDQSIVEFEQASGKMCLCVERAPLFEDFVNLRSVSVEDLLNSINATINGKVLIYDDKIVAKIPNILESLKKVGVPVKMYSGEQKVLHKNVVNKNFKVIRSNFGTIFAN